MNYYIDFDNTLYNTPKLTEKMILCVSTYISEKKSIDQNILYNECKLSFNHEHIYNIYEFIHYISTKYDLSPFPIINNVNNILLNGEEFVFDDSIPFLKNLKIKGHQIYMLSYAKNNLQYQTIKISGSKLSRYFDALFITSKEKFNLDIDYTNGIFIDDNPKDLLGLYSKNAKQVIRLRRQDNKYSILDINNNNIEEFSDFTKVTTD